MPKGKPIGFEMTKKNVNKQTNRQTDTHFRIYISRDVSVPLGVGVHNIKKLGKHRTFLSSSILRYRPLKHVI